MNDEKINALDKFNKQFDNLKSFLLVDDSTQKNNISTTLKSIEDEIVKADESKHGLGKRYKNIKVQNENKHHFRKQLVGNKTFKLDKKKEKKNPPKTTKSISEFVVLGGLKDLLKAAGTKGKIPVKVQAHSKKRGTFMMTVWKTPEELKKEESHLFETKGMHVTKYTEKSLIITGKTFENVDTLRMLSNTLGIGSWNGTLKGWVFPIRLKDKIANILVEEKRKERIITTDKPKPKPNPDVKSKPKAKKKVEPPKEDEEKIAPTLTDEKLLTKEHFKDVGEKIGMARKDVSVKIGYYKKNNTAVLTDEDLVLIEGESPETAQKLLTKERQIGGRSRFIDTMQQKGFTSGATYILTRLIANVDKNPNDHPIARRQYKAGVERLINSFNNTSSVEGAFNAIGQLKDEMSGVMMSSDLVEEYNKVKSDLKDIRIKRAEEKKEHQKRIEEELLADKFPNLSYEEARNKIDPWDLQHVTYRKVEAAMKTVKGLRPLADLMDKKEALEEKAFVKNQNDPYSLYNVLRSLGDGFKSYIFGHSIKDSVPRGEYNKAKKRLNSLYSKATGLEKKDDWSWSENKREVVTKKIRKPKWKRDVPETVERTGGKTVQFDSKTLLKEFDLKGVEYGNWMDVESSKEHTQSCGEALYDLSGIVGIDIKDISFKGRLSLGFGSRGGGHGPSNAAAHYESDRKVINLTKFEGGGTLAHEWSHALDNIFSMVDHKEGGDSTFVSERTSHESKGGLDQNVIDSFKIVKDAIYQGDFKPHMEKKFAPKAKYRENETLNKELELAGNDPAKALKKFVSELKTDLSKDNFNSRYAHKRITNVGKYFAFKTDREFKIRVPKPGADAISNYVATAKACGAYEKADKELFARAFESYISDKLDEKKMKSSYLVSGVTEAHSKAYGVQLEFFGHTVKPDGGETSYYPIGDERKRINNAFDILMASIKENKSLKKAIEFLDNNLQKSISDMTNGFRKSINKK